jgi:endogenous inhibitor of DNA gyrase (YacG/DUF329 family)
VTLDPDTVFTCPQLGKALAIKACVRRRLEPRLVTVVVRTATENRTRITEQHEAGPLHPFCALECELGREHAASVGPAAPAPAPRPPPPPGRHVWEAPDVAIGPPPASGSKPTPSYGMTGRPPKRRFVGGLLFDEDELEPASEEVEEEEVPEVVHSGTAAAQRAHEPNGRLPDAAQEVVHPAQPAPVTQEEEPMACPECKSPTQHKSTCSHRPGAKNGRPLSPADNEKSAPKSKPVATCRPVKAAPRPRVASPSLDLDAPVRELVARKADLLEEVLAIDDELRKRVADATAALQAGGQLQAVGG